jgi:anti-anti-sigma factor
LDRIVNGGAKTLVLDFDGLEYISSAGIGVLLGIRETLSQTGGRLQIVNMPSHIRRIFDVLGFSKVITIVDSGVALGANLQSR